MTFYFPAPLNIHKLCDGKNLVVRLVLPQVLASFAQTSCAYGPLHVDSESFCLEQPVLNVEDAVINFLKFMIFGKWTFMFAGRFWSPKLKDIVVGVFLTCSACPNWSIFIFGLCQGGYYQLQKKPNKFLSRSGVPYFIWSTYARACCDGFCLQVPFRSASCTFGAILGRFFVFLSLGPIWNSKW